MFLYVFYSIQGRKINMNTKVYINSFKTHYITQLYYFENLILIQSTNTDTTQINVFLLTCMTGLHSEISCIILKYIFPLDSTI